MYLDQHPVLNMQCVQGSESPLVVTHKRQNPKVNLSTNNNNNSETNISVIGASNECAVYIQNMCKTYDNGPPIIQNLCMSVKKGTIYGLLGSSGCGKTTILSCIVGLKKWDAGEVLVFGKKPGTKESGIPGKRLGYMPQELALYNQLSIREVIQLYGRIYNMTRTEMTERWVFLNKLLELPSNFKLIGDLSGGQKRRASLALALLHSPELLVLDEPTVGLDPLLRTNIWSHLYKIVNTLGTTIIITTHYIEEARLSNTIGIMRKGRLLVEEAPNDLLAIYKCELLEEVVLKLCRKDEEKNTKGNMQTDVPIKGIDIFKTSSWMESLGNKIIVSKEKHDHTNGVFRTAVGFDCEINQHLGKKDKSEKESGTNIGIFGKIRNNGLYQSSQRIYGMTTVWLLTFIRYPIFLAFILLMPSIQGSVTLWTMASKPHGMYLGVVNNDVGNWSTECNLPRHSGNSCYLTALSCKYINQLRTDPVVELTPFNNEEDALEAVHLGNTWGYILFPNNYSQHNLDRAAAKQFATEESINGSRVHVHLDYSQYVATFFMMKHFLYSYMDYVQHLAKSCSLPGQQAETPLAFGTPVYGNYDDNYTPFIMPGVITSSLLGIVSMLAALMFLADRKQGTLSRARVAGLATADVITSHLITAGIVTIGQIIVWNGVLHIIFDFYFHGSQWLCLVFCLLVGICGAGIGLLIGILCHDEVEAMVIGVFLCPIFLLFGGVFFPLESMSRFWQYVGSTLPTCLPTQSLRSIVVRGVGLMHPLVWPGFLVLIGWIVVMTLFSVIAYRKIR